MDKNKLILSISILVASIILGGFYYSTQINRQRSIEKQLNLKIAEDRRIEETKKQTEEQEQKIIQANTNECLGKVADLSDEQIQRLSNYYGIKNLSSQSILDFCYENFSHTYNECTSMISRQIEKITTDMKNGEEECYQKYKK